MAAALESRSNERPGRQQHQQQQTHGEEQQRQLRKRKWQSDERVVEEAATEKMLEAADIAFFNTQPKEHKLSLLYSVRTALQHQGLQLKRALRFLLGSSANLTLQGETWRPFFATAIGAILFTALTAIVIVALLVLTSTTNAAIASFLMSVSIIGFFVAFFFSSVSLLYFGALGFGGLTIGSVAFLSVCAVLFFSGVMAIIWVIWQALKKCLEFARGIVAMAGATPFQVLRGLRS
ncbi:hypothetical protein CY35_11G071900 [Sphagnum magellanicum]|jgi:hypothetical protein|nr:hypothetical protein CY35_11G071900 [Sphagnum magellanicum]